MRQIQVGVRPAFERRERRVVVEERGIERKRECVGVLPE